MTSGPAPICTHADLLVRPSSHAKEAGFKRKSSGQLVTARSPRLATDGQQKWDDPQTFPAPLVLPGDDLAHDPAYPAQSFQQWLTTKSRNGLTSKRKTIYVIKPPRIGREVGYMQSWAKPRRSHAAGKEKAHLQWPNPQDVCDYLEAFYHGVEVKTLPPSTFTFTEWEDEEEPQKKKQKGAKSLKQSYVGLRYGMEITRIRARPSPDEVFEGQMNLSDLLDGVISMVPRDAFAVLLLMDLDMYEDEEDEFACGRAYGGSRVCVVSSARYNPDIDAVQGIDRLHSWPASHCADYASEMCAQVELNAKKSKTTIASATASRANANQCLVSPMRAATSAYSSLPVSDIASLSALWLGRTCRTAAHELGHCFGMDHCVYYACSMQGSASICEDARQPPYLCPVDLSKLLHETKGSAEQRYQALLAFCERSGNKGTPFFAPFAAWLLGRLQSLNPVIDLTQGSLAQR